MTSQVKNDVVTALDHFIHKWLMHQQHNDIKLLIDKDEEWPSPALTGGSFNRDQEYWQPTLQSGDNSLSALEKGLDITINPQLQSYFSRYWSDNLNARTKRGGLQLLFPWNQQDFTRLQENLIAHVLMKRRLKQQDTLFFAVTDEDDFILSVLNDTGEVALEQVGREPQEILAPSLLTFLSELEPELQR